MHNNKARSAKAEQGFTLPELLVVIVIIGILAAIAVPTFLGVKRNGWDSKAQVSLRSALAAERTYYLDYQEYTTDAAALRRMEPNLNYETTDAEAQGVMAATQGIDVVVLVSTSKSGAQFCLMQVAQDLGSPVNGVTQAGTWYLRNPASVDTPPTSVGVAQCGNSGYDRSESGWQE